MKQRKTGRGTESGQPNTACTRRLGLGAFSGSLRGLELVPAKWHCLVPPTSTPQKHAGHNASRWAAVMEEKELFT